MADITSEEAFTTVILRDVDVQCSSGLSQFSLEPEEVLDIDPVARTVRVTTPDKEGEMVFWAVEWYRWSVRPFRRRVGGPLTQGKPVAP